MLGKDEIKLMRHCGKLQFLPKIGKFVKNQRL